MKYIAFLFLFSLNCYAQGTNFVEIRNSALSQYRDNDLLFGLEGGGIGRPYGLSTSSEKLSFGASAESDLSRAWSAWDATGILRADRSFVDQVVSGDAFGGRCATRVPLSFGSIGTEVSSDPADNFTDDGEALQKVVVCALNKVHPEPPPAISRMRTLNFIANRVASNFDRYGITTDVEKANLLSQIIHETGGLKVTIENIASTDLWRSVSRGDSPIWDAQAYDEARENDDSFFNDYYNNSKDTYKAAFRGRGLIQLTHCYNYMGFFLDRLGRRHNIEELQGYNDNFYYRDSDGDRVHLNKTFCDQSTLQEIADYVKEEYNVEFDPDEVISDFENTVNQLAIPSPGQRVGNMSAQEFIVDSSFYYWRKCQDDHPNSVASSDNTEFARLSGCIHGSMNSYLKPSTQNCPAPHGGGWIREAYCGRKKYRDALTECYAAADADN